MSATPPTRDRRQLLLAAGAQYNGIDFVEVSASQTQLDVHFLNAVPLAGSLGKPPVTITGGEVVASVPVNPIDEPTAWTADSEGRPVLALTVPAPGDFSTYRLTIQSGRLDPFFNGAAFSFKSDCPTTLDCAAATPACPDVPEEQVAINYLAKDFGSFKAALAEFSALRYPAWVESSEADLGTVLMEALAAIADELSYYQDRVSAESTIGTATQRLSVVRHARLVDYEPAPATVATTVLQLDVSNPPATAVPPTSWTIDTPVIFRALGADGSTVDFECEDPAVGLAAPLGLPAPSGTGPPLWATLDTRWNRSEGQAGNLSPYYWDDSERCLQAGATGLYVVGHGLGLYPGQQLLLDSPATDSADPPVRELVTVLSPQETSDPLLSVLLTQILFVAPTTEDHDLTSTVVGGNIVPAVQGLRFSETFVIPGGIPTTVTGSPVVVRLGANWTPQDPLPDYRYCLQAGPLAWIATSVEDEATSVPVSPEIVLSEVLPDGTTSPWAYERWLLDAGPADKVFTLTPEQYSPVLTSNGTTWYDYDGDGGTTIRFGDGTFGMTPLPGTVFNVLYRVGGGPLGNVPADTVVNVAPGQPQGQIVNTCTNPFPGSGGAAAETIAEVRDRAPQRFRAGMLSVVQAADYAAAARSLPWVRQAGTAFRWTGSWLTVLTSVDPVETEAPSVAQLESLTQLLDAQRLAGYESYVTPPRYVSIDLQISVCGLATYFASDVEAAVLARLNPGTLPSGATGYFDHSQWSFGQALESSSLLAAIQSCPGVDGVYEVLYRQRGHEQGFTPLPETLTFAPDEILRVDSDPSRPEAGSLQVAVEGSK